jgi:hypothetical protein
VVLRLARSPPHLQDSQGERHYFRFIRVTREESREAQPIPVRGTSSFASSRERHVLVDCTRLHLVRDVSRPREGED